MLYIKRQIDLDNMEETSLKKGCNMAKTIKLAKMLGKKNVNYMKHINSSYVNIKYVTSGGPIL